ncbi:MAG: L,D-transpeptidase [Actinomycetota bacterium]|nr:L,D-transpeptidase [Actinomycetota bacterium]
MRHGFPRRVGAAVLTAAVLATSTAPTPAAADGGTTAPDTEVAASMTLGTAAACSTGPYQNQVEAYLRLPVDGVNDDEDCEAIQRFQRRYAISPAAGYAGRVTYGLVKRFQLAKTRLDICTVRRKVVCVDLTSQVMWIAEDGKRTSRLQPVRSGRDGYETRRGLFDIYYKNIDHVSSIYGSPMPYAMFFSGGQAFHSSDRYLYDEPGSHGCVHVNLKAIARLWEIMPVGTKVHVFGRKPGT